MDPRLWQVGSGLSVFRERCNIQVEEYLAKLWFLKIDCIFGPKIMAFSHLLRRDLFYCLLISQSNSCLISELSPHPTCWASNIYFWTVRIFVSNRLEFWIFLIKSIIKLILFLFSILVIVSRIIHLIYTQNYPLTFQIPWYTKVRVHIHG